MFFVDFFCYFLYFSFWFSFFAFLEGGGVPPNPESVGGSRAEPPASDRLPPTVVEYEPYASFELVGSAYLCRFRAVQVSPTGRQPPPRGK